MSAEVRLGRKSTANLSKHAQLEESAVPSRLFFLTIAPKWMIGVVGYLNFGLVRGELLL
jgi:hypothetical protein